MNPSGLWICPFANPTWKPGEHSRNPWPLPCPFWPGKLHAVALSNWYQVSNCNIQLWRCDLQHRSRPTNVHQGRPVEDTVKFRFTTCDRQTNVPSLPLGVVPKNVDVNVSKITLSMFTWCFYIFVPMFWFQGCWVKIMIDNSMLIEVGCSPYLGLSETRWKPYVLPMEIQGSNAMG